MKTDMKLKILVHGPSPQTSRHVPRQPVALSDVALTHIVIPKFPKSAGNGHVTALWEKHEVETWHTKAGHAISRAKSEKRRQLTDFERFKVMRLRKQVSFYFYQQIILGEEILIDYNHYRQDSK